MASEEAGVETPLRLQLLATAAATAAAVGLGASLAFVEARAPAAPLELAASMGDLQHHTHKLMLSVQAENPELAAFYLHEVGEVVEQIERLFPEHEGVPVARLAGELLGPRLAALDESIERARWSDAKSGLAALAGACNDCHAAAGHGFIRVEVTTTNPFNQSFASAAPAPRARGREAR